MPTFDEYIQIECGMEGFSLAIAIQLVWNQFQPYSGDDVRFGFMCGLVLAMAECCGLAQCCEQYTFLFELNCRVSSVDHNCPMYINSV